MKAALFSIKTTLLFLTTLVLFSSFLHDRESGPSKVNFPYRKAGLTERQAAAHLLNRFTYGATPGDIEVVLKTGLEKWFQQQLTAKEADDSLAGLLQGYDALNLSNEELVTKYPRGGVVIRMAVKDGVIDKDSMSKSDKKEYREMLAAYLDQKGLKPQQELFRQFINQKILRAAYTHNQLQEVMTDFWFNHFNVSITKADCAVFIPAFERDVIRPNAFANFSDLLLATAKSPAMLVYLDNFSSSGTNKPPQTAVVVQRRKQLAAALQAEDSSGAIMQRVAKAQAVKKAQGLNENYAREVMELHTLGVDGGYTQQDVTQAAKVLTGWTIFPMADNNYGNAIKRIADRVGEEQLKERGYVHEGDFLFNPLRHEGGEKTVLGKKFDGTAGYDEGKELLEMLARHPSTARFISKKLATRFVSDNPPQSLVDRMAKTFLKENGNIEKVLLAMVSSPEFWAPEALRAKTKSPFELAISAVRTLNATITQPYQLFNWVNKMGQKMYYYQAPTGFPDKGQYWINTGALLNRMNFGLALAAQRIPGVKIDLLALNSQHEPESAEAALNIYSKLVMPERELQETIKRLTPLLHDPGLAKKVDDAADKNTTTKAMAVQEDVQAGDLAKTKDKIVPGGAQQNKANLRLSQAPGNSMLSQVVGIIIGSPEFQRK